MDDPSLSEILTNTQWAVRAAEARVSSLVEQAAIAAASDFRIIEQARRQIAESRALLAEVEKRLRPNLGPSRPIAPTQDSPALA